MKAIRWLVNSVTYRQYSLIQAVGWMILGNFVAGNLVWWRVVLIALGITVTAAILTDLIRWAVKLPPNRPAGKAAHSDRAG